MNSRLLKITYANLILVSLFVFPVLVFAQGGVGTGGNGIKSGITYDCAPKVVNGVTVYGECDFKDLVAATLHAVTYASAIAIGFVGVVIAYAGYNYMISGSNPGKRKEANSMLTKALIGLAFIVGAWLIVQFIVSALGVDTGTIKF